MTVYLVVRVGVSDIKSRWQKMFESQCLDRETPTSTVWCPRFQLKSVLFTFIVDNMDSILLKKIKNLKEINKQISPVTTSSNRKCWEYQSNMRWGRNALQWKDEGGEWLHLSRHFNPPALPPPPTTLPPTPTQPNTHPSLPPPTPHVPSDVRSVLYLFSNCSLFTVVPYFTMPAFVFAAFYELCDKFPAIEETFTKHETGDYRPA